MKKRLPSCIAMIPSIILALALPVYADMLISPTRVLLDDNNRSTTLILRNPSDGPRSYRLRWEEKRADSKGGYVAIGNDEAWPSASGMIRHSPRQITVGPQENQTVRFNWRPPANLPAGEYRSHLLLEVIPDISEPTATFAPKTSEDGIGIQVFMQMSFSIPVVVRHKIGVPQVALNQVKAVPTQQTKHMGLELTFERSGEASSYGRVVVEMQRNQNSPVEQIGLQSELTIYHELDQRVVNIPLRDTRIPAGAWVRVAYEGQKEYQGILFAEKVFQTR